LFMASKVYNVYSIANTEKNVFYSAYLSNKLQYNEVDPDKIAEIVDLTGCSRPHNLGVSVHGDIEMYAMDAESQEEESEEPAEPANIDNIDISQ